MYFLNCSRFISDSRKPPYLTYNPSEKPKCNIPAKEIYNPKVLNIEYSSIENIFGMKKLLINPITKENISTKITFKNFPEFIVINLYNIYLFKSFIFISLKK